MMVDDDPKTPEPAPAGAPAGDEEKRPEPQEGEEPESGDAETDISDDVEDVDEQDDDEDEGDDEGDDDEGKKKSSRNARYKRRAEAAEARLEEMRSRGNGSLPADQQALQRALEMRVRQEIGDPPDPRDPRYANNYVAFERDVQAYLNDERAVAREIRKEFKDNITREQARVGELVAEHKQRIGRLRTKIKDFDAVLARATVPVYPHVERLILESKRSDRLTYHLARDQAKLVKLNNSSPEAAAREIGRLEGRLSLPQPKPQTRARKPVTPLRGAGAAPASGRAEVNAYIKKLYGDR